MKHLKNWDDFSDIENMHIIIVYKEDSGLETLKLITEGKWEDSSEKGIMIRVDNAHNPTGHKHAHVALKKHINTKSKQVSWNDDGTKHDKSSFNNNFKSMAKAKKAVKSALGLDDNIILENYGNIENVNEWFAEINQLPETTEIIVLELKKNNGKQLLLG